MRLFAVIALALSASLAGAARADLLRVGGAGASQSLLARLGDAYVARHPQDRVELVAGLGSTGGVAAVADGFLQVAGVARALKPEELARGVAGLPFVETPFVFVTSHRAPPGLSRAQLPAYLSAAATWPDGAPVKAVLRPRNDSVSLFLDQRVAGAAAALEAARKRPDIPVAPTDADNLQMAAALPNSFAAAALAQLVLEPNALKFVAIDGRMPSVEALERGEWPYAYAIDIAFAREPSPATRRFIDFLGSAEGEAIIRASGARLRAPRD